MGRGLGSSSGMVLGSSMPRYIQPQRSIQVKTKSQPARGRLGEWLGLLQFGHPQTDSAPQ
jgi:hypothetical protein